MSTLDGGAGAVVELQILIGGERLLRAMYRAIVGFLLAVAGWLVDLGYAIVADLKNEEIRAEVGFWLLLVPATLGWVALIVMHLIYC